MSETMSKSGMIIPEIDSQVQLEQRMYRGDLWEARDPDSESLGPKLPQMGEDPERRNALDSLCVLLQGISPAIKQAFLLQLPSVLGLLSWWKSPTQSMFKFFDPHSGEKTKVRNKSLVTCSHQDQNVPVRQEWAKRKIVPKIMCILLP